MMLIGNIPDFQSEIVGSSPATRTMSKDRVHLK